MAAPNIVSPTTVTLKAVNTTVGTSAITIVTCGSNKAVKLSSLMAANVTATNAAVTLRFNDGTSTHAICSSVVVPANASLLVVTRDNPVYLEEGKSVQAVAGATGAIHVVASYEEIA